MTTTSRFHVYRRLYRSLQKAAKPFDQLNSSRASALSCLIHRTGIEDGDWDDVLRDVDHLQDADEDAKARPHLELFRMLLKDYVCGEGSLGIRQLRFPCHNRGNLREVIRREFRCSSLVDASKEGERKTAPFSKFYSEEVRREAAFLSLREINKKLALSDHLAQNMPQQIPHQAARFVTPLPLGASNFLKPGIFLIAHPLLTGYFRRSVICILDHKDEKSGIKTFSDGTYGLVVNKPCSSAQTSRTMTLHEILKPLPNNIHDVFGGFAVREGGPIHMAIQMILGVAPLQATREGQVAELDPALEFGGKLLSKASISEEQSTATDNDRAVYFGADIVKAAIAVSEGRLDRDDVSFFVGASGWSPGQLEDEIERGFWLPCIAPPDIVLTGICEHQDTRKGESRPKTDLWLSMISACGEAEADLAHLTWLNDSDDHEANSACDEF